jgi:hypothetical protein
MFHDTEDIAKMTGCYEEAFPQGLKPGCLCALMSELKLRPPE